MASGARDALEIFPAEVWEPIFEKIAQDNLHDLLNLSRVCTAFQRILEPSQSQWMFTTVYPHLLPYLTGHELLACRAVCKTWCRGVDNFLETFETRHPFDKDHDVSHSTKHDLLGVKGIKRVHFNKDTQIANFIEVMKSHKNPFVGHSLSLQDTRLRKVRRIDNDSDSDSESEEENPALERAIFNCLRGLGAGIRKDFWNQAMELFPLYGEHVHYLRLNSAGFDADQFYLYMGSSLPHLPNLRSLSIAGQYPYFRDPKNGERIKELVELVEHNPLPQIGSLETLELADILPLPITERMIQINPHKLKCLKICINPVQREGSLLTLPEPLPNLTELHLSKLTSVDHLAQLLDTIAAPLAPVGKLSLDFWDLALEIDLDRVCNLINRFRDTLQVLILHGKMMEPGMEMLAMVPPHNLHMLDAPHLRSLEVEGLMFGPDFLPTSCAQSLEYLHVRFSPVNSFSGKLNDEGMEFFKGACCHGQLTFSPIWKEMKKMKVIRVEYSYDSRVWAACSRRMYEWACEKNTTI